MKKKQIHYCFYIIIISITCFTKTIAQTINTKFGKNRVQYHTFDWSSYSMPDYEIFYYKGGQPLSEFVARVWDRNKMYVEDVLEYKIGNKIEVYIYNDLTDIKQSNFGANNESYNPGNNIKIVGNKIFLYFNGDHNDLERQLREGIANVMLNYMSFGSNLREVVQNALLLNLPKWFTEGLIAYIGTPWNSNIDDKLKDEMMHKKFKNFITFSEQNSRLAGHSFWNFIHENYGKSGVVNMMYAVRIHRALEPAFNNVLSTNVKDGLQQWQEYYNKRFEHDLQHQQTFLIKEKQKKKNILNINTTTQKEIIHDGESIEIQKNFSSTRQEKIKKYNAKISADGKHVAYAINDNGKVKVMYYEPERKIGRTFLKYGYKDNDEETDYNYPVIAFSSFGNKMVVFYEKKDRLLQMTYDFIKQEKKVKDISKKFTRITSANFIDGEQVLALTATNNGRSDVYELNILNGKLSKLTDDYFDDKDVSYYTGANGLRGLLLSSNRRSEDNIKIKMDSMIPTGNYDIWFMELSNSQKKPFTQITNTPLADERLPLQTDNNHFTFLSDINGVYNQFIAQLNLERNTITTGKSFGIATYSTPVSNYDKNINEISIARKSDKQIIFIDKYGKTNLLLQKIKTIKDSVKLENNNFKTFDIKHPFSINKKSMASALLSDTSNQNNIDNIQNTQIVEFISPYENEALEPKLSTNNIDTSKEEIGNFKYSRIKKYKPTFKIDYLNSGLDNGIINISELQNFSINNGIFKQQPMGILLEGSVIDMLENYRITGGIRIPVAFNGLTYFLRYDNLKKRLDKSIQVYREGQNYTKNEVLIVNNQIYVIPMEVRQISHAIDIMLKYPFDNLRSLRGSFGFRDDNLIYTTGDENLIGLYLPNIQQQQLRTRFEYVFDNTNEVALNIKQGTRYKVYTEAQKALTFDTEAAPIFNFKKGFMGISGYDIRHYQAVYRQITWASRWATAISYGNQKILFNLGGMEQWLFSKTDNSTQSPEDIENYNYVAPAMNLRGQDINVMNGNSYTIINTELRIPIVKLFIKQPIRSDFLANLQIVPFYDGGSAWFGINPFKAKPQTSVTTIQSGDNVILELSKTKNRWQSGLGIGIRSMLFGYFMKLDYAIPINGTEILKPRFCFSLSYDF